MASVGLVSCTFVRGTDVRLPQQRVETWHVNGVDGTGSMLLGVGSGPFAFELVYYAVNAADAQLWHANLRTLAGSMTSIVDDWGTIHTYALIKELGPLVKTAVIMPGFTCRASTLITGEFATTGSHY